MENREITKKLEEERMKIKNALEAIKDAVGDDYAILETVKSILED